MAEEALQIASNQLTFYFYGSLPQLGSEEDKNEGRTDLRERERERERDLIINNLKTRAYSISFK